MFTFNSDTLDEIIKGLYLGNVFQAENKALLDKNGVTHVLTVAKSLYLTFDKVDKS